MKARATTSLTLPGTNPTRSWGAAWQARAPHGSRRGPASQPVRKSHLFPSRTIVFSEPVDPTTVSTSDFVLQGPGTSGSEPITSVSGSGTTWVVGFDAIDNPGVYTLLVGPQIADIAGNVFDNNGNGIQGEATDAGHDVFNLIAPAQVTLALDPASDSGAPDYPGYTNVTTPTFDVTVNQAGTITMDFDGNPAHDQTLTASASGTYQFTAPTLSDGAYVATATFNAGPAGTAQESDAYTIDTVGPHVAAMSPSTTITHQRVGDSRHVQRAGEPEYLHAVSHLVHRAVGHDSRRSADTRLGHDLQHAVRCPGRLGRLLADHRARPSPTTPAT